MSGSRIIHYKYYRGVIIVEIAIPNFNHNNLFSKSDYDDIIFRRRGELVIPVFVTCIIWRNITCFITRKRNKMRNFWKMFVGSCNSPKDDYVDIKFDENKDWMRKLGPFEKYVVIREEVRNRKSAGCPFKKFGMPVLSHGKYVTAYKYRFMLIRCMFGR